jgi:hypothetical protein
MRLDLEPAGLFSQSKPGFIFSSSLFLLKGWSYQLLVSRCTPAHVSPYSPTPALLAGYLDECLEILHTQGPLWKRSADSMFTIPFSAVGCGLLKIGMNFKFFLSNKNYSVFVQFSLVLYCFLAY